MISTPEKKAVSTASIGPVKGRQSDQAQSHPGAHSLAHCLHNHSPQFNAREDMAHVLTG
jgi:hypothetical protein